MSINELVNLYIDGDLNLEPEFQRIFRWNIEQKSRFIESIILGIPIPSIFVMQTKKGTWDLIDGLQRVSTILELMGDLKDKAKRTAPPLVLQGTKYLPSLEGKRWTSEDDALVIPGNVKLYIKRARININIILNSSTEDSKFELFHRLNSGASHATEQEIRNCMLAMKNKDFFMWLKALRKNTHFQNCINLTAKQRSEQFELDIITRFVCLWNISDAELKDIHDINTFLNDKIIEYAQKSDYPKEHVESIFSKTFETLSLATGKNSFKKYSTKTARFTGQFLLSAFECFALGIAHIFNKANAAPPPEAISLSIIDIWANNRIQDISKGQRASTRMANTIPLGRATFGAL